MASGVVDQLRDLVWMVSCLELLLVCLWSFADSVVKYLARVLREVLGTGNKEIALAYFRFILVINILYDWSSIYTKTCALSSMLLLSSCYKTFLQAISCFFTCDKFHDIMFYHYISNKDWKALDNMQHILEVIISCSYNVLANNILQSAHHFQQCSSYKKMPTLYGVIPAFKALHKAWTR